MKIEGKFQHIYSGAQTVIALAGNRDIYFRVNVFDKDDLEVSWWGPSVTRWVDIFQYWAICY